MSITESKFAALVTRLRDIVGPHAPDADLRKALITGGFDGKGVALVAAHVC